MLVYLREGSAQTSIRAVAMRKKLRPVTVYTYTRPTSPCADPITSGAWQGSHRSANVYVTGMTRPGKIPTQARFELWVCRFLGGRLNH